LRIKNKIHPSNQQQLVRSSFYMALEDDLEMKNEHVNMKFMRTDSEEYDGGNNDTELYVVTGGVHRHPLPQAPQQITPNGVASIACSGGPEEKEKRTRSRKWSDEEVDLFLKILGDTRYMFAASLENLVPKKRSNYEIFSSIKNVFKRELKERHRERYPGFEYSMSLDLSIEKLRKKYSNLKVEWRRMSTDRQGKEETLPHFPEPRWYRSVQKLMTDIKVASEKHNAVGTYEESLSPLESGSPEGGDLRSNNSHHNDDMMEEPTFVVIGNRSNTSHSSSEPSNNNMYNNSTNTHTREFPYNNNKGIPYLKGVVTDENHNETSGRSPVYAHSQSYANTHQQTHPPLSTGDTNDYQYPYKRARLACCDNNNDTSNNRMSPPGTTTLPSPPRKIVSDLAHGLKQLAELQMKRQQMIIEADFKTYDLFLRHKEQEAEKNRAHELNLAEVYAKALTNYPALFLSPEVPHSAVKRRINGQILNEQTSSAYKTLSDVEREMISPSFSMHLNNGSTRSDQIWVVV